MASIFIATCDPLPEPDQDEAPLREALEAAGHGVRLVNWRDASVDYSRADLCLIRSTWDYVHDREGLVAWAERVAGRTALWNPAPVVRWSTHKSYLGVLADAGVPVVPTRYLTPGGSSLREHLRETGWSQAVLKPAVGAGSYHTYVVADCEEDAARLIEHVAAREMMLQPFVESVAAEGERSLIWIDGALTHVVRKAPRFADDDESVTAAGGVTDAERAVANAAMQVAREKTNSELLYGRVDLVKNNRGAPMVMELELVEPSLFFDLSDDAAERLVAGLGARLSG